MYLSDIGQRLGFTALPSRRWPHIPDLETALAEFWRAADKTRGCWIWEGPLQKPSRTGPGGYGIVGAPLHTKTNCGFAHRAAWEITHGQPIPKGLCVLHQCDTPACINPDHLWLGTKKQNTADMVAKGRHFNGRPGCGRGSA